MLQSTLIALALYKSMGLFISFISEDVTIITWIEARMFNRALQINTRQKRTIFSDLIGGGADFFYYQVHHAPEIAVFRLEEFCYGKENFCCLRLRWLRAIRICESVQMALQADKGSHGSYLREGIALVAEVQELCDHLRWHRECIATFNYGNFGKGDYQRTCWHRRASS